MRAAVNYHLTFRYLYMASRFEFRSRFDLDVDAMEIGKRSQDNFVGSRVRFRVRQIENVSWSFVVAVLVRKASQSGRPTSCNANGNLPKPVLMPDRLAN